MTVLLPFDHAIGETHADPLLSTPGRVECTGIAWGRS
jgi:hypothetical protein